MPRMRHIGSAMATGLLAMSLLSCNNGKSPLTPTGVASLDPNTPLALGGYFGADVIEAPFGRFQLTLSEDAALLESARLASAQVGQHFNVDLTAAFTETFCRDCLQVTGFEKIGTGVRVKLQIRHPFPLADDEAPVSAMNRRDLWLSTVKGIVLLDGTSSWLDGHVTLNPNRLSNADGYTSLLEAPAGFTATAFPYKLFGATPANLGIGSFDGTVGWSLNYDDPSGYLVLGNNQTATASYDIRLSPGEQVTWDLVLTGAYAVSAATKPDRLTPEHYMPAGAAPEPFLVRVTPSGALQAGNASSTVQLSIEALDWQQSSSLSVDPNFPSSTNRRGLAVSSKISGANLGIPEITGVSTQDLDVSSATGQGTLASPWTLTTTLTNTLAVPAGTYTGIVKIIDERVPEGGTPPLGPVTFISKDLVTPYTPPSEFATYGIFQVSVSGNPNCLSFDEFWNSDADAYSNKEPLYEVAESDTELADLLGQLTTSTVPLPPIDWATQKVVVACTGSTPSDMDLRSVSIQDICPNAFGLVVTVRRGEPLSGCTGGPRPAAPYALALVTTGQPEWSFVEEQFDTCTSNCTEVPFDWVDAGDSVELGGAYAGGPNAWLVKDQLTFTTVAGPLYGPNPLPVIDFRNAAALVVTSGRSAPQDGRRYAQVTQVCEGPSDPSVLVTWEAGEYLSCTPAGNTPSSPFQIVTIPAPVATASFDQMIVDVCNPGGECEDSLPVTILAQADVTNAATGGASYKHFSSSADFNTEWSRLFPEIAPPAVNFPSNDAWIMAFPQRSGMGSERMEITCVSENPTTQEVIVKATHWQPLSPGCDPQNSFPSRLVTVFSTPKLSASAPDITFDVTPDDICNGGGCGGPILEVLDKGNGAAHWASGFGTDMAIFSASTFQQVWRSVKGNASTPPAVDFNTLTVLFTTTGWHNQGQELYGVRVESGCDADNFSGMQVADQIPVTCPPPLPVPTTPYEFVTVPKGTWNQPAYTFSRRQVDVCDPGENCIPEFAEEIDAGDYPDNVSVTQFKGTASSNGEFVTLWNSFFTNAGTRPPRPPVNFTANDVLLSSSGFTPDGEGFRFRSTYQICVESTSSYLRVESFLGEPMTCAPGTGPSHPWTLILIPKGTAGYNVTLQDDTFDVCPPPEDCFEFESLAQSDRSAWTDPKSNYVLLADPDLNQRKADYRTIWAELGPGDPPGINDLQDFEAVVVLIYGYRTSHRGLHSIEMGDYCLNGMGLLTIDVGRFTPLSGCNGIMVDTSPYSIYKAPIVSFDANFLEDTFDSCP